MNNQFDLHSEIYTTFYQKSNTSVHCMMGLSSTQWARYENSSIHLGGSVVESIHPRDPKVIYKTIKYGANIKPTRRNITAIGGILRINEVILSLMKYNMMLVTTNKVPCLIIHKGVQLVDNSSHQLKK